MMVETVVVVVSVIVVVGTIVYIYFIASTHCLGLQLHDVSVPWMEISFFGYLSSPQYPALYPPNVNATCVLAAERGQRLQLVVSTPIAAVTVFSLSFMFLTFSRLIFFLSPALSICFCVFISLSPLSLLSLSLSLSLPSLSPTLPYSYSNCPLSLVYPSLPPISHPHPRLYLTVPSPALSS